MFALGVYSATGIAGAAVAEDGRIVSAVSLGGGTVPGTSADEVSGAVTECLATADVDAARIERVAVVDSRRTERHAMPPWLRRLGIDVPSGDVDALPAEVAHASFLRGVETGHRVGMVLCRDGRGPGGSWLEICNRRRGRIEPIEWAADMHWAIAATATALGGPERAGVDYLEDIAGQHRPGAGPASTTLFEVEGGGLSTNRRILRQRIEDARTQSRGLLHTDGPHVVTRRARAELATEVLDGLARALADVALRRIQEINAEHLVIGGSTLESAEFQARLRAILGARTSGSAHAGEAAGALGAALYPFPEIAPIETLALGCAIDEQRIKTALENRRLEYVYEPDWNRLRLLVSELLSSGAFVAWFQGRCDFGPVSYGSRSVLADPSRPYARDNIRTFLLRQQATAAIPVTLTGDRGRRGGFSTMLEPLSDVADSDALTSTADPLGRVKVTPVHEPELSRLIELHRQRTGVPGLVTLPLRGTRTPLAWTPGEAIATVYASAVEVAVLGRFIVAKDYWSLRRQ